MKKQYANRYQREEESHWWIKSRREIIEKFLDKEKKSSKILDVGCSGGSLLKNLEKKGFSDLYGIDISKEAIKHAKDKGLSNVAVADAVKTGFKSGSFDVVIASDILEHIKNDEDALKEWLRILKKGGKAIIFVPAFNVLWTKQDEVNVHLRRYTRKSLVSKIGKNARVLRSAYWNFLLFFPKFLVAIFMHSLKPKNEKHFFFFSPPINTILLWLVRFENFLISKGVNFPIGVSVFAVIQKK